MKLNLIIQSFGRESEYKRAVLTILSFYAHSTNPPGDSRVLLFTDNPSFFSIYFEGVSVEFILLTPEKIKEMRGKIDFLHRMKIAVIEEAFALCDGMLLYADSDTFFIRDPLPLVEEITASTAFMHLPEYPFEKQVYDETNTYKNFYSLINSQDFELANGTYLAVTPNHWSWNAGVMMFHPSHAKFIPDVYALTDQFYPKSLSHASEQYAFSLVVQSNVEIRPCDEVVYHYWYRVKKHIADLFLEGKMNSSLTVLPLPQRLSAVKTWTRMLPRYFEDHILMIRDNALQAFNKNHFLSGYKYSLKAIVKSPFSDIHFIRDVLYHTKRRFVHSKKHYQ